MWCDEKGRAFVTGEMRSAMTNLFTAVRYKEERKESSAKKKIGAESTGSKSRQNSENESDEGGDASKAKRTQKRSQTAEKSKRARRPLSEFEEEGDVD